LVSEPKDPNSPERDPPFLNLQIRKFSRKEVPLKSWNHFKEPPLKVFRVTGVKLMHEKSLFEFMNTTLKIVTPFGVAFF